MAASNTMLHRKYRHSICIRRGHADVIKKVVVNVRTAWRFLEMCVAYPQAFKLTV